MRILAFVVTIVAAGAMLTIAPVSAQTPNASPYCWSASDAGKKCTFATMDQCEMYAAGTGGWCELNNSYSGPLPPLRTRPDGW